VTGIRISDVRGAGTPSPHSEQPVSAPPAKRRPGGRSPPGGRVRSPSPAPCFLSKTGAAPGTDGFREDRHLSGDGDTNPRHSPSRAPTLLPAVRASRGLDEWVFWRGTEERESWLARPPLCLVLAIIATSG